jgi:hypothetical protein
MHARPLTTAYLNTGRDQRFWHAHTNPTVVRSWHAGSAVEENPNLSSFFLISPMQVIKGRISPRATDVRPSGAGGAQFAYMRIYSFLVQPRLPW